jgi:hypothetical protein
VEGLQPTGPLETRYKDKKKAMEREARAGKKVRVLAGPSPRVQAATSTGWCVCTVAYDAC